MRIGILSSPKIEQAKNLLVHGRDLLLLVRNILVQIREVNRDHTTNPLLHHGHPVHNIGGFHRSFVVGHNDELRFLGESANHLVELINVGIIKWGIHLVKNTEWSRLVQVNGKKQSCYRQGFLSPGQLINGLGFLALGLSQNLNRRVQWHFQDDSKGGHSHPLR